MILFVLLCPEKSFLKVDLNNQNEPYILIDGILILQVINCAVKFSSFDCSTFSTDSKNVFSQEKLKKNEIQLPQSIAQSPSTTTGLQISGKILSTH